MRASHGQAFWWRSLFTVFWLQGALLWFVSLPLLVAVRAAQPTHLTVVDGLGILIFAVGFGFEVVGDAQLERFKAQPEIAWVLRAGSGATRGIGTTSVTRRMVGAVCHAASRPADG
jgi:steroid 5-alpha reductase family enzyme